MDLRLLPDRLAVCRLAADAGWPAVAADGSFVSVTRTRSELSVVCATTSAPPGAEVEPGWRVFEVSGPLSFGLLGVISSLTAPLADAGVSVFVLSTFDTDYLLVREATLSDAATALRGSGHRVDDLP